MAKRIKPEDLFDFDGYEQRIKDMAKLNDNFGKANIDMINHIKDAQKPLLDTLQKYIDLTDKVNVSQKGATDTLKTYEKETEDTTKAILQQKKMQDLLNETYNASDKSIKILKDGVTILRNEYEKLDPTQKDFADQQAKIAQKSKELKVAIDAQSVAIKAATSTVRAAEGSYAALNKETNELRNRLKNLPDAFDKVTGAINKTNKEATELQRQITQNDKVLKNFDASIGLHQRNVGNYSSALTGLGKNVGALGLAFLGLDSAYMVIDKLFTTIVEFDRLDSALKNVTTSTQEFNRSQNFIEALATKNGQNIQVLTKQYMGLLAASRGTNLEGVQTQKIFTAITNAGAALKMSNYDLEGALRAVQQMMSKGSVQSEELRGQLGERLYGAFNLAAKAIGVTTAELGKMLKDGKVLASDLLPKFAEQLDKLYGDKAAENAKTISGSFENMKTQASLFIKSFNDNGAITSFFSRINNGLAGVLEQLRLASKYNNILQLLNPMTSQATMGTNNALENRPTFEKDLASFEGKDKKERAATLKAYEYKIKDLDGLLSDMYNKKVKANDKDIKANEKYLTDLMKQKQVLLASDAKLSKSESALTNPTGGDSGKKDKALTEIEKIEKAISELNSVLEEEVLLAVRANKEVGSDVKVLATLKELDAKKELLKVVKEEIEVLNARKKITANVSPITTSRTGAFTVQGGSKTLNYDKDIAFDGELNSILSRAGSRLEAAKSYKQIADAEKVTFLELEDLKLKAETKGQKARLDLAKKEYDQKFEWAKLDQQRKQELIEKGAEIGIQITNQLFEFSSALRQKEIENLQMQKDHELGIVGDNAEARGNIEKKFAAELLEIKRKQARADKAQAAFNIGVSTAQGIMASIRTLGLPAALPFVIATGILGAIQLATVLAKPLPQFFKGTDNAPEGLAWVAEKGAELRETNGKMMYYDKPQITWLNQGDKIHTAEQTSKILAQNVVNQELGNQAQQNRLLEIRYTNQQPTPQNNEDLGRTIEKAFGKLPIHTTVIDKDGFKEYINTENSKTTYNRTRYSLPK